MVDRRSPVDRRKAEERREYGRLQASAEVRFLRAGTTVDEVLSAELLDVSHNGVSIALDTPLIRGECVAIEVRSDDGHCWNLAARAVWVEIGDDDRHRVGCELRVELTRKQFLLLQQLVGRPRV